MGSAKPPVSAQPHTLRIFLVDDSALIRERLEALLDSIPGVRTVGSAQSVAEATPAILAAHPDAVVLDLQLADGSGFDVLRALRRAAPDIGVYVLTNHAAEPYRRLAIALGAREFFDKSTEFERVREALAAQPPRAFN